MDAPKFSPGQRVSIVQAVFPAVAHNDYEILRVLPFEGRARQYRVKGLREAFERIVGESALRAIGPDALP